MTCQQNNNKAVLSVITYLARMEHADGVIFGMLLPQVLPLPGAVQPKRNELGGISAESLEAIVIADKLHREIR